MNRPKNLYHFTSLETLSLILSTGTIRFRRLDFVDDPVEAMTADLGRQGKYILVSCWTNRADEDLLQWSMYGNLFRGVRIRIPADSPFDRPYRINEGDVPFARSSEGSFHSSIQAKHLLNDRYTIPPGDIFNQSCSEVKYTNDQSKLLPRVLITGSGTFGPDDFGFWQEDGPTVLLSEIGKYKNRIWSTQSEWRFMVPVFPMNEEIFSLMSNKATVVEGSQLIFDAMRREQDPTIENIDVPFKKCVLDEMEITLGPRATTGDRVTAEAIRDKFAPKAVVRSSELVGRIR